ncbi:MAG: efflux RND transporter periplasmic adaptor subunit [Burkholderiaceae bacterium]|nr:efflux RND transporter periplasmic adaptor subunit [Burkholderiaceae bacterium]
MPRKRILLSFAIVLAALAAIGAYGLRSVESGRTAAPPAAPVPVSAALVVSKTVPFRLRAVGNIEPWTSVAVKALVDGQIVAVHFREGEAVRRNALLFEIDPRPSRARLAQAQANLLRDQALLDRARQQQARSQDLLARKFISPDAYEQVRTTTEAAAATVAADRAAIDSARLDLEHCSIRSPIDGFAGRILIQAGNLVKANDTNALVVLNQVVPIYASFSVPEQYLGQIRQHQARGDLLVQAQRAGVPPPVSGKLVFIDNAADTTTGTIRLQAKFANADKAFWPGQFVDVSLTLYEQADAVVVPSIAVQNGPGGQYVFVIGPDAAVALREVRIERVEGDDAVVASGLAPGERVVTTGQIRLAPGTRVKPDAPASGS